MTLPWWRGRSFATRLALTLLVLLLAYGTFVALLGRRVAAEQEQEAAQRLSYGLARHIVEHWPEITSPDRDLADRNARAQLLSMLMTVNPAVQVYLLDADGRVQHYIGEPGMVREPQVDLAPVRAFLAGAPLPLHGTDPMGSGEPKVFSAAMFAQQPGDTRPPGYLYVVLDGPGRQAVADQLSAQRIWRGAALAGLAGLLATGVIGVFTFRRLSQPLHRLARRLHEYSARQSAEPGATTRPPTPSDEVQAIESAFVAMTARLESQAAREAEAAAAHRETMASVAHDLRTPLTALHGHLEALADEGATDTGTDSVSDATTGATQASPDAAPEHDAAERRRRILADALAQSRRVGRLSQQLFELAALQSSSGPLLHRERFRLDELVTDAVQKYELTGHAVPPVTLSGRRRAGSNSTVTCS